MFCIVTEVHKKKVWKALGDKQSRNRGSNSDTGMKFYSPLQCP